MVNSLGMARINVFVVLFSRFGYGFLFCVGLAITSASAGSTAAKAKGDSAIPLSVAPDWVVSTTCCAEISLHEELQRDHKVVLVFWASWCRYCKDLLPKIQALADKHKEEPVTFVSMNIWQEGKDASPQNYLTELGIEIPVALRADALAAKYKVKTTPSVFLIGKDFEVLYQYRPGKSPEEAIRALESLL